MREQDFIVLTSFLILIFKKGNKQQFQPTARIGEYADGGQPLRTVSLGGVDMCFAVGLDTISEIPYCSEAVSTIPNIGTFAPCIMLLLLGAGSQLVVGCVQDPEFLGSLLN